MPRSSCRMCKRPLRDRTSRLFGVGPDCRRGMTDAQLRDALALTKAEADPAYIPPERPPSPQARHNNATARAVIERAVRPETATCHHDGIPGRCPQCRAEADPWRAARRIIGEIKAARLAVRDAAYEARHAAPCPDHHNETEAIR